MATGTRANTDTQELTYEKANAAVVNSGLRSGVRRRGVARYASTMPSALVLLEEIVIRL